MTDHRLLDHARSISKQSPPTAESLRELTARFGIDLATAVLYDYLRADSPHAAFIRSVDELPPLSPEPPRIVIVPGAFHVHHHHTGADGRRIIQIAAELGWPAERVPVPSLGTMGDNAKLLLDFLAVRRDQPVVLVSLSKGAADVRTALTTSGADLAHVSGWLSLSGLATGTPLINWLRRRPLRYWGARALLAVQRHRFAALHELRSDPGSPLRKPFVLPPSIRAIHVVGFPTVDSLSHPWARRAHARLAPLGPNDGGGFLLADALKLPGNVYPVWQADHYLRPAWNVVPMLQRLLQIAAC